MTRISSVWPWVAPFGAFMLFLGFVDGTWPEQHYVLYPVKCLLVAGIIAWFWRELPSLKPVAPLASVVVGIAGVVLWVGLAGVADGANAVLEDGWNRVVSQAGLSSWQLAPEVVRAEGRDPFQIYPAAEAWVLFVLRVAGIALVVPIMEELFWRGFLMRWLIREDFEAVPLGTYRPFSFWATTVLFASVHGSEWLLGLVVGTMYGAWFVRTKSLGNIMVAHGVTNLLLALYCLCSGDWHFLSTGHAVTLPK